jgi:hypothetical protein
VKGRNDGRKEGRNVGTKENGLVCVCVLSMMEGSSEWKENGLVCVCFEYDGALVVRPH